MKKNTKIVATIGPSSDSVEMINKLYKSGMNVARLNFSHGNHEYFTKVISNIRKVSDRIAILLDTKGPEIRTGEIKGGEIEYKDNQKLLITNKEYEGDKSKLSISYNNLNKLKKGDLLLIDDGFIELIVIKKEKGNILTKVINGGVLGSKKTVSIQGHNVEIPFLSKKDKEDIKFGIKQNVDFVAASFVREKKDIEEILSLINKYKSSVRIISKIEHVKAVENFEEIIYKSSGVMIARGDLGVEVPLEDVPMIQKKLITKCNELGKPVIVATQMLESMKSSPRPTRAEVSDVVQAILQGADALMLSGETANGKYPIDAIETMSIIIKKYENSIDNKITGEFYNKNDKSKYETSLFVTRAVYESTNFLNIKAILTPTESGFTARKVSRFKPKCLIYAVTHNMTVLRQLQLSWGVYPIFTKNKYKDHKKMINGMISECYNKKLLEKKDNIVITSGDILSVKGLTNRFEIYKVKRILDR